MRWAEGPVYFPEGRYLLVSDIPNNRVMKYDELTGKFTVFKENANYANGNTRDRQGRLISCEHSVTRRVVRFEKDGRSTVLADSFEGKKLNSPNDIVVKSDDTIWFTDPLFGINGEWEGTRAKSEQATTNVYRIGTDTKLSAVITDLLNPNGLAFSPDEKKLYVVEWRGTPNRSIWSYDVAPDGSVSNKTKLIDAAGPGSLAGFRVDRDGNLWCGWGFTGAFAPEATDIGGGIKAHLPLGKSEEMDGVKVFSRQASRSASSGCPSVAPTLNSAAPNATGCTWPAAIRSTRCMWRLTRRSEFPRAGATCRRRLFVKLVHGVELLRAHRIAVGAVFVVGNQVVARVVVRAAFLGRHAAGLGDGFGPDRRAFDEGAAAHLAIGSGEHVGVDGVDLALVVDQPVAALAALLVAPLAVGEALGLKQQLDGYHILVGLSAVAAALSHGGIMRQPVPPRSSLRVLAGRVAATDGGSSARPSLRRQAWSREPQPPGASPALGRPGGGRTGIHAADGPNNALRGVGLDVAKEHGPLSHADSFAASVHSFIARSRRAEPATISKRNSRHSIGPFHIGTRRDSFKRMRCGSLRSGVSTQAVQPG